MLYYITILPLKLYWDNKNVRDVDVDMDMDVVKDTDEDLDIDKVMDNVDTDILTTVYIHIDSYVVDITIYIPKTAAHVQKKRSTVENLSSL